MGKPLKKSLRKQLIITTILILISSITFGQTQDASDFLIKEVDLGGYYSMDNVYHDKDLNFFILRRPDVNHVLLKVDSNLNVSKKSYPLRKILTADDVVIPVSSQANTIIGNESALFYSSEVITPSEDKLRKFKFPDFSDLRGFIISPNAKFIICLPSSNEVKVYAWFANKNKWRFHGIIQGAYKNNSTEVSGISQDGRYLALAFDNYRTVIYDLVMLEEVQRISTGRVNNIHFYADKMAISTDKGTHIYSTAIFQEIDFIEHGFYFCNTHIDENGQYLVAYGLKNKAYKEPNSLELYDLTNGKRKDFKFKPSKNLEFVRLARNGKLYTFSNYSLGLYNISNLKDL